MIGFDPGKSTGVAIICVEDRKITPKHIGVIRDSPKFMTEVSLLLDGVTHVVVEDFRVRPGEARRGTFDWDGMIAPVVIGRLQALCEAKNLPFELQQPALKPVGYGLSNQKYRAGAKGMHSQDALAHAVYFAVKRLGALPVTGSAK